jgi:DNA-directed RNA polymerase specialized sigma subunit
LKLLNDRDYKFIVSRFFNGLSEKVTADVIEVPVKEIHLVQLKALEGLEKRMKQAGQHE